MKRLLLTSTGLNNIKLCSFFVNQFDRLDNKRACLVTTQRTPDAIFYINEATRELQNFGITVDIANISDDIDATKFSNYDIYYSCGGNTFYILDRMRKTGMDTVLMNAIQAGKFYIGVSAGSMIVGPDISLSDAYGEDGSDANDVGLEDLSGFNLIPYYIMPHYEPQYEAVALAFQSKITSKQAIIGITDTQALFVTDAESILIGDTGGIFLGNTANITKTIS
jgi:dipeptidase E